MGAKNSKNKGKGKGTAAETQQVLKLAVASPEERSAIRDAADTLGLELDEELFLSLLTKLIGESKFVQNFPPELVPEENRIVRHIVAALSPHTSENGGPLMVETVSFTEGRSNVIIRYEGSTDYTVSLVGSHLDVVPADPETWERDPFTLKIEGDKLYGRGTTDCLGHVALVTCFFVALAKAKPDLAANVVAVFIASEENDSIPGVGVDGLMKAGRLDDLKNGVVLWVDASDSEPCMGTAGAMPWHLRIEGKRFHSGLPHKGINPIELGMEALSHVQRRFYESFPQHPEEKRYKFLSPSTMKPTQIKCASGSLNQIPPSCTISGDIRLNPFYDVKEVMAAVEGFVAETNELLKPEAGPKGFKGRGPSSKYTLPEEGLVGKVGLKWGNKENPMRGIACNIDSPGFFALESSIKAVRGSVKPYSISGSLPLVQDMKESGFDLQITGFGLSSTYHADNEYCQLSDMKRAAQILSTFVSKLDKFTRGEAAAGAEASPAVAAAAGEEAADENEKSAAPADDAETRA